MGRTRPPQGSRLLNEPRWIAAFGTEAEPKHPWQHTRGDTCMLGLASPALTDDGLPMKKGLTVISNFSVAPLAFRCRLCSRGAVPIVAAHGGPGFDEEEPAREEPAIEVPLVGPRLWPEFDEEVCFLRPNEPAADPRCNAAAAEAQFAPEAAHERQRQQKALRAEAEAARA